jgi:dUTP pyrophosphatase
MEGSFEEINVLIDAERKDLIPHYASEGASGADVRANIEEDVTIKKGETFLVPTGVRYAVPAGYEIQVRPRSGLAFRNGITVLNTPGTLDSDYRGELKVILINHGGEDFVITPGMRVAQIVVAPVVKACFLEESDLKVTLRGENGFGHTGTH